LRKAGRFALRFEQRKQLFVTVGVKCSWPIRKLLDKRTPAAQRNFRRSVRGLVKWAIGKGLIDIDPFATVTLSKMPKPKGEYTGIIPWAPEECEQFEKFYPLGTKERLAYELLLQAGQSKCDVIRMGRQHIRNGMLSMRRKKTNVSFHVEVGSELSAAIKAMPPSDHLTFLVGPKGEPFTQATFGNWFRKVCNSAGLPRKDSETGKPRCTSHGLRKVAASRLAARGGTTTELKATFGWKTSSEADLYTEAADRERAARSAASKIKKRTRMGKPGKKIGQTED
jgi:integrase